MRSGRRSQPRPFSRRAGLALVAVAWWGVASAPGAALEVPFLSGRVVDNAGLLPAEVRERLDAKLAELEQKSGAQVAVLTLPSLEGEDIEGFSIRVADTWKLGRAEQDDGVLFLVASGDRKMRLEVGYGLESTLTDLVAGRILDHVVRPRFAAGDFPGGIEAGVDAVIGTLEGRDVVPEEEPSSPGPLSARLVAFLLYLVVAGVFSSIALFSNGAPSWFLYFFLMPFHFLFPAALSPVLGAFLFFAWVVGFPLAKAVMKSKGLNKKWITFDSGAGSRRGSWRGSSWGGFGGGGGGFSGGGFSGGGGGFGGGGSSSSW